MRPRERPSKFGCFTCRARRVKCDETKPSCARCEGAGRCCEGYPRNAPSASPDVDASTKIAQNDSDQYSENRTPKSTLSIWHQTTEERGRLLELGFVVLAQDPYNLRSRAEAAFWSYLLPQLSRGVVVVGAAVAAFGAVYEAQFLRKGDTTTDLVITKHYSHALRLLSQQVQSHDHGSLPLVLTCTILAAMETIRRHQSSALTHAKGAINLLTTKPPKSFNTGIDNLKTSANFPETSSGQEKLGLSLCRDLDLTIVSSSLRRAPVLPAWASSFTLTEATIIEQASTLLTQILHSCFSFAAKAVVFKYRPRSEIPVNAEMGREQSVANLLSWLNGFEADFPGLPELDLRSQSTARSALILKAHCLFALIYISTIFAENESAYDTYATEFGQIIECAEAALKSKGPMISPIRRFCLNPGVIVPLRLTTAKCRDPQNRRKAIRLLSIAGSEGPLNGPMEATISTRIVQIEEEMVMDSDLSPSLFSRLCEIREEKRICYSAVVNESGYNEDVHRIIVQFSRRIDPHLAEELGGIHNSQWQVWQEELVVK